MTTTTTSLLMMLLLLLLLLATPTLPSSTLLRLTKEEDATVQAMLSKSSQMSFDAKAT